MGYAEEEKSAVTNGKSLYERAVLGFRNYWYPACSSSEVKQRPTAVKLLGDPIMLLRRKGKAYALADECAHRGTQLSLGKCQFPGTNTITCPYHGWTYDVTTGKCVAVLPEGPDSPVVGKMGVRSYPLEERKGIVWIWMGRMKPVPLEEDVPKLMLREDTVVKAYHRVKYGNWRWHAENVGGGHAPIVHRDKIYDLFSPMPAYHRNPKPVHSPPEDDDGKWVLQISEGSGMVAEYPGLGRWPRHWPWQRIKRGGARMRAVQGLSQSGSALRLPGYTRVVHYPLTACIYYEWYVPVDEDHYVYFQVTTAWPKNVLDNLWFQIKYYLKGLPLKVIIFNNDDLVMVRQTTDYAKRVGWVYHCPLSPHDRYHAEWRKHANQWARGEGEKFRSQEQPSARTSGIERRAEH